MIFNLKCPRQALWAIAVIIGTVASSNEILDGIFTVDDKATIKVMKSDSSKGSDLTGPETKSEKLIEISADNGNKVDSGEWRRRLSTLIRERVAENENSFAETKRHTSGDNNPQDYVSKDDRNDRQSLVIKDGKDGSPEHDTSLSGIPPPFGVIHNQTYGLVPYGISSDSQSQLATEAARQSHLKARAALDAMRKRNIKDGIKDSIIGDYDYGLARYDSNGSGGTPKLTSAYPSEQHSRNKREEQKGWWASKTPEQKHKYKKRAGVGVGLAVLATAIGGYLNGQNNAQQYMNAMPQIPQLVNWSLPFVHPNNLLGG